MAYKKIIGFLLVLSSQLSAVPWYLFSGDDEFDEVCENKNVFDQKIASEKLYASAVEMENLIQPIAADDFEKIHDNRTTIRMLLSFLIKASDFGHKKAKVKLIHVLTNGMFGVDKDPNFAERLKKEIALENPYIEPKPWYEIFEAKELMPQILQYDMIADKETRIRLIYDFAAFLFSIIPMKNSRNYEENFVFFLSRASMQGSIEAKRWLAKILHEGSYGVKRDNEMANNLEAEVAISELSGFEKILADDHSSIEGFQYDHAHKILEIYHPKGFIYYYGAEAKHLHKIFSYLKDKHLAQACSLYLLANSDLESVD